jgi:hypothetical protein
MAIDINDYDVLNYTVIVFSLNPLSLYDYYDAVFVVVWFNLDRLKYLTIIIKAHKITQTEKRANI